MSKIFWRDGFQKGVDYGFSVHRRRLRDALLALGADLTFDEDDGADVAAVVTFPLDFRAVPGLPTVAFTQLEISGPKDPLTWFEHISKAAAVVTSCRFSAEAISRHYAGPVSVVPLGVDSARFPFCERKQPGPDEPFQFLWLNNYLNAEKQIHLALMAWHNWRIRGRRPLNARLYIKAAGIPGGTKRTLSEAPPMPIGSDLRSTFPDVVYDDRDLSAEELTQLISESHAYVSTSAGEGWSLGTTECMSTGLPCIVPWWSAFRDYCDEGVSYPIGEGTLVPFWAQKTDTVPCAVGFQVDPYALLETMDHVCRNYSEALERGRRASERMRDYTWEASARRFLQVIEKHAGSRAAEKVNACRKGSIVKKALITIRSIPGDIAWWEIYKRARERFTRYAEMHGYEYRDFWYADFTEEEFPGVHHGRLPVWPFDRTMTSPCWLKLPAIAKSLEQYDLVVYFDTDCLILDFSKDIGDELPPDKWLAMHEDTTYEGTGPNIGVVVTRACEQSRKFWREAWDIDAWRTATWTDQGQAMHLLGFTTRPPVRKIRDTEYTPGYHVLGWEWNGSGNEPGTVKPGQRVFHAAYGESAIWKLGVMRDATNRFPIPMAEPTPALVAIPTDKASA